MDAPPQAPPFRMVDRVLERETPGRCVTVKLFSAGEFLTEGAETVPAALVVEALCQAAVFVPGGAPPEAGRIARLDEVEILGEIRVGDRLVMTTLQLESGGGGRRVESRGEVEGRPVARVVALLSD